MVSCASVNTILIFLMWILMSSFIELKENPAFTEAGKLVPKVTVPNSIERDLLLSLKVNI